MIEVPNLKILESLPSKPADGEIAKCTTENKYYKYSGGWEPYQPKECSTGMTLYDINKQIMSQKAQMTFDERLTAIDTMHDFVMFDRYKYYMLLSKDIDYYTIFAMNDTAKLSFITEFFSCIDALGIIKSIDLTEGKDAIEVWITNKNNQTFVMYFFPYDAGVIECRS